MLERFVSGLMFGAGFAVAFVMVGWMMLGAVLPRVFAPWESTHSIEGPVWASEPYNEEDGPAFHELSLDQQIERASVIAIARFESAPDGERKAIFREVLKQSPGTTFHYKLGDEYARASYYPRDDFSKGDGVVIFFVGSPASMRMSMTYSGDRIQSLGDIPLELFKQKCESSA